uniref:Uncharacterized protein n=1 Tax=Spongospora subterranea TaxID=70186 RepID=A0A0H5RCS1_9EUKA|eukprot:CRZ11392.1 hypothetical protein [Spongospora subterranea]
MSYELLFSLPDKCTARARPVQDDGNGFPGRQVLPIIIERELCVRRRCVQNYGNAVSARVLSKIAVAKLGSNQNEDLAEQKKTSTGTERQEISQVGFICRIRADCLFSKIDNTMSCTGFVSS